MEFAELKIGEVFQFDFEKGSKWVYEKYTEDLIKTVGVPKTETKAMGKIYEMTELLLEEDCHIIPVC